MLGMHSLDEVLDKQGNTPLHYCAIFSRRAVMEQIISTADQGWERLILKRNSNNVRRHAPELLVSPPLHCSPCPFDTRRPT